MPSIFAITPDDEKVTVRLTAQGRGEFAFTVTNMSGKAITARARITAKDPSQLSWYKIQDDPQRNYPGVKGVEKFTVQIAAPATAAPGTYSFHLDVISIENPDELFTIGPAVSVEVPQPVKKQPMKLWPILAGLAAVIVIGLALWYFLRQKTVPNFVGLSQTAADAQAQSANLKIGQITWQRTGKQVANTVLSQTPAADAAFPADGTLNLVLEQAPFVVVPDLVGSDIAKAQDALTTANLTVGAITNDQTAAGDPNTVLSQNPAQNLQVAPGTPVALVVKANTVQVPSVVGQPIAQAISTITQNHLVANPVATSGRGTLMTVSSQSPAASSAVTQQTSVTLYYITTASSPPLVASIPMQQYTLLSPTTKANIQRGPNIQNTQVKPK
jgi:beta-lactam-binding protein with PASTA domain